MFDDIIKPIKFKKYDCFLSVELDKLHISTNRVYVKDHLVIALTNAIGRHTKLLVTNNPPDRPGLISLNDMIGHCTAFTVYYPKVLVQVYSKVDLTDLKLFPNGMGTILSRRLSTIKSFTEISKDFTISSLSISKI